MHVHNSRGRLVRAHHCVPEIHVPVLGTRHRVRGNFAQVLRLRIDQIFQRLWRCFFVQRVVVNRLPHHRQVAAQRRFFRAMHRTLVHSRCNAYQDHHDRHDDHEFEQRETSGRFHAAPLRATSLHILFRRWPCPAISNTHQRHSSRTNFWNPGRPTRTANPIRLVPSSGPPQCVAIIVFSFRLPRPPHPPFPHYPRLPFIPHLPPRTTP